MPYSIFMLTIWHFKMECFIRLTMLNKKNTAHMRIYLIISALFQRISFYDTKRRKAGFFTYQIHTKRSPVILLRRVSLINTCAALQLPYLVFLFSSPRISHRCCDLVYEAHVPHSLQIVFKKFKPRGTLWWSNVSGKKNENLQSNSSPHY